VTVADYLRKEFAYNAWANRAVLAAIRASSGENSRSLQLMSHILAAERVWLERLRHVPQSVPVWPEADLTRSEADAQDLEQKWHEYLDLATAGDLLQTISYKNTKARRGRAPFWMS